MSIEQQVRLKKPYKKLGLSIGKKKTGGRNNQGRITAFHRGGGNKLRYIYINTSTAEKHARNSFASKYIKENDSRLLPEGIPQAKNFLLEGARSLIALKGKNSGVDSSFSEPLMPQALRNPERSASLEELIDQTPDARQRNFYASGEVRYLARDPNRTAWIAGIFWSSKEGSGSFKLRLSKSAEGLKGKNAGAELITEKSSRIEKNLWYSYYSNIIAPEGLTIGATVTRPIPSIPQAKLDDNVFTQASLEDNTVSLLSQTIGNTSYLKDLMVGTIVHNIDGKYIRAAGCSGIIISKVNNKVTVKLQSGQSKIFSGDTLASIGIISNAEHKTRDFRKAGQKRWLGRRPIVRGVAMNPIDHPHGGGEGKSSGGRPSVTPWGKPTKGKPTRSPKKPKKQLV